MNDLLLVAGASVLARKDINPANESDPSSPTKLFIENTVGEITVSPSGRYFARHTSGKATVIQYNYHGKARRLVVPDAVYRKNIGNRKWGDSNVLIHNLFQFNTNTKIFNRDNAYLYNSLENNIPIYVEGSTQHQNVSEYADIGVITDDQMNALLLPAYTNENKTARECGDICVSERGLSAFPALQACRNFADITIDGGFDLPLMHDLCVMYVEGNTFDALDPTATDNDKYKLGKGLSSGHRWRFNGGGSAWGCQQCDTNYVFYMSLFGSLESGNKNGTYDVRYILPIRELFTPEEFVAREIEKIGIDSIYRHENNKGSVIEFKGFNNETIKLFVADAQYRTKLQWGTYGTDVPSLTNFSSNNGTNWFIKNSMSSIEQSQTAAPPFGYTLANLKTTWSNLSTDKTARQNCDIWMTYNNSTDSQSIKGVPAVAYARGLTDIFSGGCDIPNEFELMVVFLCMNAIDALDPTVDSYPAYALGNIKGVGNERWLFNSADYCWSSTEDYSFTVRSVRFNGACYTLTKESTGGVLPVREL